MVKANPHSYRNLASEIVSRLRQDIISGSYKPGAVLTELVLSSQFGVSRAPVREALIELERVGLVQTGTTGRTRVRTMQEKDIIEIIETRVALETMGVRLAAKRWEAQHTRHIEDCIAQQEKAVNELEFSQLDISMHEYIMTCSGNERLLTLWQYIRWQFEMALVTIHQLLGKRTLELRSVAIAGHWKVLESLTARKAEQAAKTMAQHIVRALEWSVPEDVEPTPTPSTARRRQSRSEGA